MATITGVVITREAMIMTKFGPDKLVRIKGTVPKDGTRFDINLRSDRDNDELARFLHLAFRVVAGTLTCNYFDPSIGGWSSASVVFSGLPIKPGSTFEVDVVSDAKVYKIYINNAFFCEYKKYLDDEGKQVCIDVRTDVEVSAMIVEDRL